MEARAQWITARIDSKRRRELLDGLIPEQKEIAATYSKVANELDEACREMSRQIVAAEERLSSATDGCHRTEREIGERLG